MFLTMAIPDSSNPKHLIDLYLEPLIDELLQLWHVGVRTHDHATNKAFMMRVALMLTVNDLPAYGMVSGWNVAGLLTQTERYAESNVYPDQRQKRKVCEWVKCLRFPDRYASNLSKCVDMTELRLHGMKSHDCHIFMQKLILVTFREMVPKHVWSALTEVKGITRGFAPSQPGRSRSHGRGCGKMAAMEKLQTDPPIPEKSLFEKLKRTYQKLLEKRVSQPTSGEVGSSNGTASIVQEDQLWAEAASEKKRGQVFSKWSDALMSDAAQPWTTEARPSSFSAAPSLTDTKPNKIILVLSALCTKMGMPQIFFEVQSTTDVPVEGAAQPVAEHAVDLSFQTSQKHKIRIYLILDYALCILFTFLFKITSG
ncbi:UNVERIFIED_CONTAM: hypothetical protein Scaly_1663900 [Sesamum calycinum]|uniref:Uncharacterized protein n=1 Tax=Sesamum calycinum TaxID=2727403 RepID=A0AAW2NV50_9LAMI